MSLNSCFFLLFLIYFPSDYGIITEKCMVLFRLVLFYSIWPMKELSYYKTDKHIHTSHRQPSEPQPFLLGILSWLIRTSNYYKSFADRVLWKSLQLLLLKIFQRFSLDKGYLTILIGMILNTGSSLELGTFLCLTESVISTQNWQFGK